MGTTRGKRKPVQLSLDGARRPTGHGGWRPGAGRPRGKANTSHGARAALSGSAPLHVTLRVVEGVPSLRREAVVRAVRAAIAAGGHRVDFRVVHFNVLGNHLHLIVEAASAASLGRGMQGLNVRLARRINVVLGREGALFAERYHVRALRTPREVRNALRYVLLNGRHHAAERGQVLAPDWIDPYSSALWFDGWREVIRTDQPWMRALTRVAHPTATPRTWLLSVGWRRAGGPIAVGDVPGPPPAAPALDGGR